jgi:glycerate-2-kinase
MWVVGAGKASAAMAQAVEAHWDGDPQALGGLVVTRYGHEAPCADSLPVPLVSRLITGLHQFD